MVFVHLSDVSTVIIEKQHSKMKLKIMPKEKITWK